MEVLAILAYAVVIMLCISFYYLLGYSIALQVRAEHKFLVATFWLLLAIIYVVALPFIGISKLINNHNNRLS